MNRRPVSKGGNPTQSRPTLSTPIRRITLTPAATAAQTHPNRISQLERGLYHNHPHTIHQLDLTTTHTHNGS